MRCNMNVYQENIIFRIKSGSVAYVLIEPAVAYIISQSVPFKQLDLNQ